MDFNYIVSQTRIPLPILMRIGQDVRLLGALHQVIVFSLVLIFCRGLLNDKAPHLDLVLKQNIEMLLMLSLKPIGFEIYCADCINQQQRQLLFIVKM